jgi:hypothetical protein
VQTIGQVHGDIWETMNFDEREFVIAQCSQDCASAFRTQVDGE